jgi:hypothetical protein
VLDDLQRDVPRVVNHISPNGHKPGLLGRSARWGDDELQDAVWRT